MSDKAIAQIMGWDDRLPAIRDTQDRIIVGLGDLKYITGDPDHQNCRCTIVSTPEEAEKLFGKQTDKTLGILPDNLTPEQIVDVATYWNAIEKFQRDLIKSIIPDGPSKEDIDRFFRDGTVPSRDPTKK